MNDPALQNIGPALKAARLKRNLTLTELADRSGMSASTLSRLESGKRQANLELLLPLTRQLRIGIDELITPLASDPRVKQRVRRSGNMRFLSLSPESSTIKTYKMTISPSKKTGELRVHDGYDWIYVLRGRLRLILGEQEFVMELGEAAEFDTRIPHWMGSAGPGDVEILGIFNEAGARMHTRTH